MRRRLIVTCAVPLLAGLALPALPAQAAAPTCFGTTATIVGTDGPDHLVGQSGVADVIYGGGGNDTISGGDYYSEDAKPGAAADLICGGTGDDDISGSPGDDRINGGDGDDQITGDLGADVMQGNVGDDTLIDESIADSDAKNDILRGGTGNDTLLTGFGVDKAYGDAGNDTITDWECSTSYLFGGAGADVFESYRSSFEGTTCGPGTMKDHVDGQDGTDRAKVSSDDSVVRVESVTRVRLLR